MNMQMKYLKEKWNHAGFQKYLKNASYAISGKIFSLIITFFIGLLVARYLGPQRYGLLNYVLSFVAIFTLFANLGVDNILIRELIRLPEQRKEIINAAFSLKFLNAFCTIALIFIASSLVLKNPNSTTFLIFLYSLSLLITSFNIFDLYFQSEAKFKNIFIAQILAISIASIARIIFIHSKLGTGFFLIAYIIEITVWYFILFIEFKKHGGSLHFKINIGIMRELLSRSWPFILSNTFLMIYSRIDQIMIGNILGNHSLGVYSAGVKIAELWYFIPLLICSAVFPSLVSTENSDKTTYKRRFWFLFLSLAILSLIIAAIQFFFAKFFVIFLFGTAYEGATGVLQIYAWAGIFISMATVAYQDLLIRHKTKKIIAASLTGAILNILLNLIMIPKFGLSGSAWATFISYALVPTIMLL